MNRRWSRRVAVLLAAWWLGLVGCSGGDGLGLTGETDPPGWADLVSTLTEQLDQGSDNPCASGLPTCIPVVVAEMQRRLDPLADTCDHRSAFAYLYLRMTETVGAAVAAGDFGDPAFLQHQDAVFARAYFDAYDAWASGDRDAVPGAWRIAFTAAEEQAVSGIGDLLLGASAHINRDLAYVMEQVGVVSPDGRSRRADYDQINVVIEGLARPVLNEAAARFDPTIALFDVPGLTIDEQTAGAVLAQWRTEAFVNAERLLAAPDESARQVVVDEIEATAELRGNLIVAATSYPPLLPSAQLRESFCRSQG